MRQYYRIAQLLNLGFYTPYFMHAHADTGCAYHQ